MCCLLSFHLDVAAGIDEDLFFVTLAGGQAYKRGEDQKGVEFLHSSVFTLKKASPAEETGLPCEYKRLFRCGEFGCRGIVFGDFVPVDDFPEGAQVIRRVCSGI